MEGEFTRRHCFCWFSVRELLDGAQLHHLHLDLAECKSTGDLSEGQRHTQAALVAALRYLKCRISCQNIVNGIDYRNVNPTLMLQLRASIAAVLRQCTTGEIIVFAGAHLWSLYVGAMYEMEQQVGKTILSIPL